MVTEPQLETRNEQPYAAIRARVRQPEIGTALPPLWPEVFRWLGTRGIAPSGAPFIRYVEFDRSGEMDVEAGVPVAATVTGDQRVVAGVLPFGTYASLIYTGHYSGLMEANHALHEWVSAHEMEWQYSGDAEHSVWAGRLESYPTDPAKEPDPAKWITIVSCLTRPVA